MASDWHSAGLGIAETMTLLPTCSKREGIWQRIRLAASPSIRPESKVTAEKPYASQTIPGRADEVSGPSERPRSLEPRGAATTW